MSDSTRELKLMSQLGSVVSGGRRAPSRKTDQSPQLMSDQVMIKVSDGAGLGKTCTLLTMLPASMSGG